MITPFTISVHSHVYSTLPKATVTGSDGSFWLSWGDLSIFGSKHLLREDLEKIAEVLNEAQKRPSPTETLRSLDELDPPL